MNVSQRLLALLAACLLAACDGSSTPEGLSSNGGKTPSKGNPTVPSREENPNPAPEQPSTGEPDPSTADAGTEQPGPLPEMNQPKANGFFASATIEEFNTVRAPIQGDLWANCWSDDDNLWAANGDGYAFLPKPTQQTPPPNPPDILLSTIRGTPATGFTGSTFQNNGGLSRTWSGAGFNRKPTGMLCIDGNVYLAVQDLALNFDRAPAATLVATTNKGQTFTYDTAKPMFSNGVFTTMFFLDYGKNSANAKDGFVYIYGLDNNWRDSFSNAVADPQRLQLARVPKASVMDRTKWTFFAGLDVAGNPTWSENINDRKGVLEDTRRVYGQPLAQGLSGTSVISQGSVVFNAPLNRYLYTSWTEFSFDFYESPTPWGPWKLFFTKDFGRYPWFPDKHGGYATTIPSKFISDDGKTMWVLSATFTGGFTDYAFSMRKFTVQPFAFSDPSNARSVAPLTAPSSGAVPFHRALHYGRGALINNGQVGTESEDSWNGERNATDWWGYTFDRAVNLNKVVYTTGAGFPDGGWFTSLRVEVRRNFVWTPVTGLAINPAYPFNTTASGQKTFTLRFADTWGDGVRIIGAPGGTATFTSISELSAYYE